MDNIERRYLYGAVGCLAVLAILILLSSCQPAYSPPELTATAAHTTATVWPTNTVSVTDLPTATVTESATPTQEGPHWSTECLPDDIIPINPNPCPVNYTHHSWDGNTVQEIPSGMGLRIGPNEDGIGTVPDAPYYQGAVRLHTYGFVGEFGVTETVQMFANRCYTFNVPVTINLLNSTEWDNFIFYSTLYADNGTAHPLNEHAAVLISGDQAALAKSYPNRIFWAFQPSENVTVEWEVGFRSVWATSSAGNFIDFEAFYIQDQFNTQICN